MTSSRLRMILSATALLAIAAGCVPVPAATTAAPTATPALTAAAQATTLPASVTACPEPERESQTAIGSAGGYCLLFPRDYDRQETGTETVYFFGSLMDVSRPKLFVKVEDANGQTAVQTADAAVAEVEAAGLKDQVKRMPGVSLGGEQAERLDNMSGQDLGRVLIAVHGPRTYRLTFVPADPGDTAMMQQTEALYNLVVRSFRFTN